MFLSMGMPLRFEIWFDAIIKAAAEVNPLIMGFDMKFTRNPAFSKLRTI